MSINWQINKFDFTRLILVIGAQLHLHVRVRRCNYIIIIVIMTHATNASHVTHSPRDWHLTRHTFAPGLASLVSTRTSATSADSVLVMTLEVLPHDVADACLRNWRLSVFSLLCFFSACSRTVSCGVHVHQGVWFRWTITGIHLQ